MHTYPGKPNPGGCPHPHSAMIRLFALLLGLAFVPGQDETPDSSTDSTTGSISGETSTLAASHDQVAAKLKDQQSGLWIDRGETRRPLFVPDAETLNFSVQLSVESLIDADVGTFVLSSGTEPFRRGLPKPGESADEGERAAWIKAVGDGGALGYSVDQTIETRLLPQAWPRGIYRDTLAGSSHKKRELMYGDKQGELQSWYRSNHHCHGCDRKEHFVEASLFSSEGHCNGCSRGEHRIWLKPITQKIPEGAIDMLSAVFLARAMVRSEIDELQFPMLQKQLWWDVTLARGDVRDMKVPAGVFTCRQIKMSPTVPKGVDNTDKFKGLFGIHGTLSLWVHEVTGVPVVVEGIVPIGPLDFDVSIELSSFSGTPKDFAAKR
mgnify:FL=1